MSSLIRSLAVVFTLAVWACSPSDPGGVAGDPTSSGASLGADLSVGSRGDDVQALHTALTELGYFPNRELSQRRPTWRPVVPEAPADPATYDERSAQAVRALQRSHGLPETGTVDVATRELLRVPSCGVPASAPADPSEKFSLSSHRFPRNPTIYWTLRTTGFPLPAGLDAAGVRAAIATALQKWAAQSPFTFQEITGNNYPPSTIAIRFVSTLPGGPDAIASVLADTGYPNPTGTTWIEINNKMVWSLAATTPARSVDFPSLILHELGHALGIDHSGYPAAVMYGKQKYGEQRRNLIADDKVAVSYFYDVWKQLPGTAWDISINAGLWIVGTAAAPGGYEIKKWNGNGWTVASGNRGGVRVAADPLGGAWITDQSGNTWAHGPDVSVGSWTQVPGCATDIGISGQLVECAGAGCNPTVYYLAWKVGCANGDGLIHRMSLRPGVSPSAGIWVPDTGSYGRRIAVEREGNPWVVTGYGDIWRRSTSTTTSGSYEWKGDWAIDIGVGPGPYAWMTGGPDTDYGYEVYLWNQQLEHAQAEPPAPALNEWNYYTQNGTEISVDSNGNPYLLSLDRNSIWTTTK